MKIVLVSKAGCPRCLLAEDKLKRLGLEHTKTTDVSVIMDMDNLSDSDFPVILIDGGAHSYPHAMKILKEATREADA